MSGFKVERSGLLGCQGSVLPPLRPFGLKAEGETLEQILLAHLPFAFRLKFVVGPALELVVKNPTN